MHWNFKIKLRFASEVNWGIKGDIDFVSNYYMSFFTGM